MDQGSRGAPRGSLKTSDYRRHIPLGIKLHACLLLLGFTDEEIAGGIQWNHNPALGLRTVDPETGKMIPDPNDARYIEPLRTADHKRVTNGGGATTAGSDKGRIAKTKRLEVKEAAFRKRLLAIEKPEKPRSKWPKRAFRSKTKTR